MNSDMNNDINSADSLSRWLGIWKERARTRSIFFGLLLAGLLVVAITLISAIVGFRVAYDDTIINAFRLILILGIGLTYWFFIRNPLNQLDKDYRADELESRFPELKGELRTYLEESSRTDSNPILGLMAKSLGSKLSRTTPEELIPQSRITLLKGSFASTAVLLLILLVASGANLKFGAQHFLSGWFLPDRLPPQSIVVTPGDSRLKRGSNLTVSAQTLGFDSNGATIYAQFGSSALGTGSWDEVPMRDSGDSQYEFSFYGVHDQLNYYVEAAGVRSETHTIDVVDVPGIQAIRVTYYYPEWTGLEDRVQETGTRIQGIEGTRVEIEITSDRPLLDGQLLALDQSIELEALADAETNISRAELTLEETGTYYIADRLDNELIRLTDDYSIAVLTDQAPRVSITLPGADRGASSIEEVPVRIEVQDDFKVDELKLNFSVNAGDWVEIDLAAEEQRIEADYLMMLEDLIVSEIDESGEVERLVPGDLISYFVSAEDHTQEVTSDIYFIDIQPFDKRYSQAEGGAGAGGAGGAGAGGSEDEISERQKEILVATWNLQKEQQNEDADENYLEDNAFMLSELQRTLAEQTQTTLDRLDARRLVSDPRAQNFAENMEIALEAMQPAADHLLDVELEDSVTPQQTALQHLLRAEAQFRDIQVSIDQQNANGGAGGAGGGQRDLTEIYELEMDMSRNQYETRQTPSLQQPQDAIEDAFDQLEELSRRQEALAEQARRNNELSLSERWEQEQLTREAQQLQEQLDQLQQQQQQSGQQGSESQQAATEALQQSLEEIIENMQQAADSAASGQPGQPGSASSSQEATRAASEQLQQTLDALNEARQQQFRETIGDLAERSEELQRQQQAAASQLEDALERAMDSRRETGDYISGLDRDQEYDLADLKREMADEVADISETLDNLVDGYSEQLPTASSALRDATEVLDEARLQTRLTEAAEAIEYGLAPQVSVREFVVTDAIDRLRERTEAAAALSEIEMTRDRPETGPTTAEQLSNLRERLERNLTAGTEGEQQEGQAQQGSGQGQQQATGEQGQQGAASQAGSAGQGQPNAGQAGFAGGNNAGVIRGGFDDGSNRNLGADFDFTNPATRPLATDANLINDQATETAGQLLALSNQLIAEGISDEEIVRAQELARDLANQTGDAQRIADSLRALIGQLEKLELGLDLDALSRNNLELNSGGSSSAEDDEDVAEYFRNLSELPVR